jgi:hypothetical protein
MLFNLNGILQKEEEILYNLVSVSHAEIPASYYVVNNTNNLLVVTINNATPININLINGNYNAQSFATMILAITNIFSSIYLSPSTGKYGFTTLLTPFTIESTSTCSKLIGITSNTRYTASPLFSNYNIVCPYPANFFGPLRLKIKSQILKTDNMDAYSKGCSNELVSIPVNAPLYGLITYINITNFKSIFQNNNLDYIDLSITDDLDQPIDFNGVDVFITIQIDSIRKSQEQNDNLIQLLQQNMDLMQNY